MNLPFLIARKYFFSNKKRKFIHFISLISMIGIAVGTAALIIVLSVFNGLEELNRSVFKSSDPDILLRPTQSRTFDLQLIDLEKVKQTKGVTQVIQVLEDNALAKKDEDQVIVKVKGVDSTFQTNNPLEKTLFEGQLVTENDFGNYAFVGAGLYSMLNLQSFNLLRPLEIWYPRNQKLNALDPESNISRISLPVSGAFILEQKYDNLVYLPIHVMEELTDRQGKRTALELRIDAKTDVDQLKKNLKETVGEGFEVLDRDEQNAALFKAIKIEKIFIFIALLFIIGIASFNIFFALTMLVIDKKSDISTLSALGADKSLIMRIFLTEGGIISLGGSLIGMVLGIGICLSQIYFGWLSMGMEYALVDAYPVALKTSDIVYSFFGIIVLTFLASILPSKKAQNYIHL